MQIGHVLFEVFQRVPDLQGEQAAQAGAVPGRCHFGFVEHLDGHRIAGVDQRWKADQGLALAADFHQFGQLAEVPRGVASVGQRGGACFCFGSCWRFSLLR